MMMVNSPLIRDPGCFLGVNGDGGIGVPGDSDDSRELTYPAWGKRKLIIILQYESLFHTLFHETGDVCQYQHVSYPSVHFITLSPKFLFKPSLKLAASLALKIDDWKTTFHWKWFLSWDIVKFQGGYGCSAQLTQLSHIPRCSMGHTLSIWDWAFFCISARKRTLEKGSSLECILGYMGLPKTDALDRFGEWTGWVGPWMDKTGSFESMTFSELLPVVWWEYVWTRFSGGDS